MFKFKSSQKIPWVRIMKIAVVIGIVSISFFFFLRFIVDKHIAQLALYDVSIPAKPAYSGKLYAIGDKSYSAKDNYLLVLTSKEWDHRECYYINIKK